RRTARSLTWQMCAPCVPHSTVSSIFFFFQAEDGIRDWSVTGVQTCALPIWTQYSRMTSRQLRKYCVLDPECRSLLKSAMDEFGRSEERRVGKECRYRWSRYH